MKIKEIKMNFFDLINMARQNLWRTKLRTSLTLIGVIIGIGALISMVSFGVGIEDNIVNTFKTNDLFTSLTITSKAANFGPDRNRNKNKIVEAPAIPLNDSLIEILQKNPNIAIAYPKINTPVKAVLKNDTIASNTGCLPIKMATYPPYNDLYFGNYFSSDSAKEVIVSLPFLESFGLKVLKRDKIKNYKNTDTNLQVALADTIIGKTINLISSSIKDASPFAMMMGLENIIGEEVTPVKIVGILKEEQFSGPTLREELIIPLTTAKNLPSLGFDRVSDLIDQKNYGNDYTSIFVKAKSMEDLSKVKDYLNNKKLHYFSIDDGLTEMKKAFRIMDSILGIIGFISLIVAGFGIVNTMLMSIMERKREIGIMKAVGGKNNDIRMIFFFEAGFIGVVGAIGGIALGYGITRIANLIVNQQFFNNPDEMVDMFSFPIWLTLGAVLFSILISLIAGMYPAIRASKIHPIDALRQVD